MKKSNKKRVLYVIFGLILLCTTISITYAYYTVNYAEDLNTVTSVTVDECVVMEITDSKYTTLSRINISGDTAVPISDSKALSGSTYSYYFTIKNNCSTASKVNIYLVTASDSTMPLRALKTAVKDVSSEVQAPTYLTPSTLSYGAYQEMQDYLNNSDNFTVSDTSTVNYIEHNDVTLSGDIAKIATVDMPDIDEEIYYKVYLWIGEEEGADAVNGSNDKISVSSKLNAYLVLADTNTDLTSTNVSLSNLCAGFSLGDCASKYSSKFNYIKNVNSTLSSSAKSTGATVGGMYRYIGYNDNQKKDSNYDVVDNNYICFGATGTDCTNDDNLYRIIGITGKGILKIQKYTSIGTYQWYGSNATAPWQSSLIYNELNGESTQGNYFNTIKDSDFLKYVYKWDYKNSTTNYGLSYESTGYNTLPATDMYSNYEYNLSTAASYFGLIYPSDYALSNPHVTSAGKLDSSYSHESWMYYEPSDTSSVNFEWTMIYYGNNTSLSKYTAWGILKTDEHPGYLQINSLTTSGEIRPVAYLKPEIKITAGNGTKSNPFIISCDECTIDE